MLSLLINNGTLRRIKNEKTNEEEDGQGFVGDEEKIALGVSKHEARKMYFYTTKFSGRHFLCGRCIIYAKTNSKLVKNG